MRNGFDTVGVAIDRYQLRAAVAEAMRIVGVARPVMAGTRISPPTPLFSKLDPSVVNEELARLASG